MALHPTTSPSYPRADTPAQQKVMQEHALRHFLLAHGVEGAGVTVEADGTYTVCVGDLCTNVAAEVYRIMQIAGARPEQVHLEARNQPPAQPAEPAPAPALLA